MKFLSAGFRNALWTMVLMVRVFREPGRYLSEPNLAETELAAILAMVWRIMLFAKLIEILPWTGHPGEASLLILVFLGATPLALAVLRALSVPINGCVRFLGGGNDRNAAKRAMAISSIFPNPLLCLYLLSPTLSRYFGPVGSTFVLYGICGGAGTVLTWLSVAKAYRLSPMRSVILVAAPTALTLALVLQVPFYFIDRYSPTVVKGDVDLGVLDLHRFPLDSSVDGSHFMKRELLDLTVMDSVELVSAFKRETAPDPAMVEKLSAWYRDLAPLLRATYFDKRRLPPAMPEIPLGPDSAAVFPVHGARYHRYGKIMILHASHRLSVSRFREAESIIRETLEFIDALGKSNLGLVGALTQSIHARKVSDLLADNLLRLRDPAMVRVYADLLFAHKVDPECLLNSLRLEYYQVDAVMRQSSQKAVDTLMRMADSTGFYFPGYTRRKFLDPQDTHEILRYLWAKTLVVAAHPTRETVHTPPEFQELAQLTRPWRLLVYKNTFGRILTVTAVPIYAAYGKSVLENRRHMEAAYAALMLRAVFLETGKLGVLSEIPGALMFRDSFSLRNDTLVSADSLRSEEIFSLAIR